MSANGIMRSAAYWLIKAAAWLFINVMAAIGVLVALFWLLANAEAVRFFAELGNLAGHFGAATPQSQAEFCRVVMAMLGVFTLAVSACRLSSLREATGQEFLETGRDGNG